MQNSNHTLSPLNSESCFLTSSGKELIMNSEIPFFDGNDKSLSKINGFYRKKYDRMTNYYKKASQWKDCSNHPDIISLTYKITADSDKFISILRKISFTYDGRISDRYYSENWDNSGNLILLKNIVTMTIGTKRSLTNVIYNKCISNRTIAFNKNLKRSILKHFSDNNFFFKKDELFLFFQPGDIADEKYGLITVSLNPDSF